jgi:plastocyanin
MMEHGAPRTGPETRASRRWLLAGLAGMTAFFGAAVAERATSSHASTAGTPAVVATPSPQASPAASPMASPAVANRVTISNFAFTPATIEIAAGTEVTWTNQDDIPHTATSNDGKTFTSPLLDTDDEFHQRFTKPGTYPYHCALHPFMTAKVIAR